MYNILRINSIGLIVAMLQCIDGRAQKCDTCFKQNRQIYTILYILNTNKPKMAYGPRKPHHHQNTRARERESSEKPNT